MVFSIAPVQPRSTRQRLSTLYREDEAKVIQSLLDNLQMDAKTREKIQTATKELIEKVRKSGHQPSALEEFLQKYQLNSKQGLALMALAEALLRIPDQRTAVNLIRDKLAQTDWHTQEGDSLFIRSSEQALKTSKKLLGEKDKHGVMGWLADRVADSSRPFVIAGVKRAIRMLSRHFVMAENIVDAIKRSEHDDFQSYQFSYDMLGEVAKTKEDAEHYYRAYLKAIYAIGRGAANQSVHDAPGISIKLSALHPRFEHTQSERILAELVPKVAELCRQARLQNISLTIDAEEANRLDLTLDVIERLLMVTDLSGWDGLGLAVQAYQKRAMAVLEWVEEQSERFNRRFIIRLVKGAYWDSEIKWAQEDGLEGYPVFTRKHATDVSYIACAEKMFEMPKAIYPAFATHNAHTVATILEIGKGKDYEFQRLKGMGRALYDYLLSEHPKMNVRLYAPVGPFNDLLPYLVRRLLENGANSSFVNQVLDEDVTVEDIATDPVEDMIKIDPKPHPKIKLPEDIFPDRKNAIGFDLSDHIKLQKSAEKLTKYLEKNKEDFLATSIIDGRDIETGDQQEVIDPTDHRRLIGKIHIAGKEQVEKALSVAQQAFFDWSKTDVSSRAEILNNIADLIAKRQWQLIALLIREGGRTINDGIAEVREAIDFCRYYALQAQQNMSASIQLPGPVGETNEISWHGRGVFVCISPWNFPLAIFTGQIVAALVTGNTVVAKPAEQTSIIAYHIIKLMHDAGVPPGVLQLLVGSGQSIGSMILQSPYVAGVAFTGSTTTAQNIQQEILERGGALVPLIAETGGQNACIVDSSALPEQVVNDVVMGAFRSAGQRCSATRVLYLPNETADKIIKMLAGAMEELSVGDPLLLSTDVGPVISFSAAGQLTSHIADMHGKGKVVGQSRLPVDAVYGNFVSPTAIEIDDIQVLREEVFGPILHIIRYPSSRLNKVCESIQATGYGLTLGLHTRLESTVDYVRQHMKVGNIYVNRSQIGAVVGSQPFGGEGLSGTGFKAGGPHYLYRFGVERTFTVNTTAAGGNASLINLEE